MGSRVMHYGISVRLLAALGMSDDRLLLGGIAPDTNGYAGLPKAVTHYLDSDGTGRLFVNYERFLEEQRDRMTEPFYVGYYCHLVADDIWLRDFYYVSIKDLPPVEKREAQQRNYRDFVRLNGRLIEAYGLTFRFVEPFETTIEGVDRGTLTALQTDLGQDFESSVSVEEPLEIHTMESVEAYMDKCVSVCLRLLKEKSLLP